MFTYINIISVSYTHLDFPQYSLYEMRERDSRAVLENEYLKRAAYEQMRHHHSVDSDWRSGGDDADKGYH